MPQRIADCKRVVDDDEFYTRYRDCVRELHKYDLRGRKIICPCDTRESNIYLYLKDCYYDVHCDSKEWRNVDYSKYDLVITNPPFSQKYEFIDFLISKGIDFIVIVSDVMRYSIKTGKKSYDIPIYSGKDAQKFIRPDGSIRAVHCGWISNIPDDYEENKIINK